MCLHSCSLGGLASTSKPSPVHSHPLVCSHCGWAQAGGWTARAGAGTARLGGQGHTTTRPRHLTLRWTLAATEPLSRTICWGLGARRRGSHRTQPEAAAPGTLWPPQHASACQWPAPRPWCGTRGRRAWLPRPGPRGRALSLRPTAPFCSLLLLPVSTPRGHLLHVPLPSRGPYPGRSSCGSRQWSPQLCFSRGPNTIVPRRGGAAFKRLCVPTGRLSRSLLAGRCRPAHPLCRLLGSQRIHRFQSFPGQRRRRSSRSAHVSPCQAPAAPAAAPPSCGGLTALRTPAPARQKLAREPLPVGSSPGTSTPSRLLRQTCPLLVKPGLRRLL